MYLKFLTVAFKGLIWQKNLLNYFIL